MRSWLRSNWVLKVTSLLLAMVTWFFVKAVTSDSRLVEGVPLEVRVKPGLVADTSAKTVNVTVRGTTEDIRLASRNELYAVLDLTHEDKPGAFTATLSTKAIRHPRRVQVVAVEPANVNVRLTTAND